MYQQNNLTSSHQETTQNYPVITSSYLINCENNKHNHPRHNQYTMAESKSGQGTQGNHSYKSKVKAIVWGFKEQ